MSTVIQAGADEFNEFQSQIGRDGSGFWYVLFIDQTSNILYIAKSNTASDTPVAWTVQNLAGSVPSLIFASAIANYAKLIVITSGNQQGVYVAFEDLSSPRLRFAINPTGDISNASAWFDFVGGTSGQPSLIITTLPISGAWDMQVSENSSNDKTVHWLYSTPSGKGGGTVRVKESLSGITGTDVDNPVVGSFAISPERVLGGSFIGGFMHLLISDGTTIFTSRCTINATTGKIDGISKPNGTNLVSVPSGGTAASQSEPLTLSATLYNIDMGLGNSTVIYIAGQADGAAIQLWSASNGVAFGLPTSLTAISYSGIEESFLAIIGRTGEAFCVALDNSDNTFKVIELPADTLHGTYIGVGTIGPPGIQPNYLFTSMDTKNTLAYMNSSGDYIFDEESTSGGGGLTLPYKQKNYMGEWPGDSAILEFIKSNKWDSTLDGLGTPQNGMQYYDTDLSQMKYYNGTTWIVIPNHATNHENGGDDEIDVAGLSGLLADDQNPVAHDLGGVDHNADTIANLQTKVSDATIVVEGSTPDFAGLTSTDDIELTDPGTSVNSKELILTGDNAGTPQSGGMKVSFGADPYLQISAPHETTGVRTPVVDLHRTGFNPSGSGVVDLGSAGNKYKDIHMAGDIIVDGVVDGVGVADHSARHENGGADEITVAGLSGVLTDPQTPTTHVINDNARHGGIPAGVLDNVMSIDGNGLPKDSGIAISSLVEGIQYKGTWNATTNSPTLIDGTGTTGDMYKVSVAGSQDLGSGSIAFEIGDWVLYNGSTWEKVDHTDQVTSVFGRMGTVAAQTSDYDADQIDIGVLGTPTYDDAQDFIDIQGSAGQVTGGTISDNGDQTFAVTGGTGFVRDADSHVAPLSTFDFVAVPSTAIPDGVARHVFVDYNGGAPIINIKTSFSTNTHTEFFLGSVVREGLVLHIFNCPDLIANPVSHINEKFRHDGIVRVSGIILGETGTRNVTVTAGETFCKLNEFPIDAFDSSGADDFDTYIDGVQNASGQTQWDNNNYNNAGVKTALTVNRYGVLWFYHETDGGLIYLYGTSNSVSVAGAQAEPVPSTIPLRTETHGYLIGRIIFQKGDATATLIETAFGTTFSSTVATNHNNLAGLQGGTSGELYHLTNAEYINAQTENASLILYKVGENVVVNGNNDLPLGSAQKLIGRNITSFKVQVITLGVGTDMTVMLKRLRAGVSVDVLNSVLSIPAASYVVTSTDIDLANDDFIDGDILTIDIISIHGTTAAKGCIGTVEFT